MSFEQVERDHIDQFRLPLEGCEHIGREAGGRISLARDPLADVALGVEELGAIGRPQGRLSCR
jgi:hypothetical protein